MHDRRGAVPQRGGRAGEAGGVEGSGPRDLALGLLDGGDLGLPGQLLEHRRGPSFVGEALFLVHGGEGLAVGVEVDLHHPVGLGDERAALPLPVGDEHQGGRLHPAHAQERAPQAGSGEGDEARERGAPDEVDVLPGLPSPGQRFGEVVQMREGPLDLARSEGREARPAHATHQLGILLQDQIEGLKTYQFALTVVVGGDYESRGVHGEFPDGPDHRFGRLGLDQRSVDESLGLDLAPLGELGREVHLHDVSFETDSSARFALLVGEEVVGDLQERVFLDPVAGQDPRDLLRGIVLLSDYQSHQVGSSLAGVSARKDSTPFAKQRCATCRGRCRRAKPGVVRAGLTRPGPPLSCCGPRPPPAGRLKTPRRSR